MGSLYLGCQTSHMKYLLKTLPFSVILLAACSTTNPVAITKSGDTGNSKTIHKIAPDSKKSRHSSNAKSNTKPDSKDESSYNPFSTDTLYSLMVAELAASRKQYNLTLDNYIQEAKATGDLGVIIRAARLAQYFRDHDQAIAMGKLWVAQKPDDIEANSIIATACIERREPLMALDYAERILALIKPSSPEANKSAAITETIANYSRSSDTLTKQTLAERYADLAKRYPQYASIKVGLSILYESQEDTAAAYKTVKKAIAQDDDYLPAIMQEIRLLQASKQNDKAIAKLEKLLDSQPDNNRLRLLYARLLTQIDINAAYEQFSILAQQSPQHLDIQFSKALIAFEIQKTDVAQSILEDLLTKNYRRDTVNFYLGNLAELNKDNEKALSYYLAVNAGEDYVAAHSRAARIMAKQGELQKAQAHFNELRNKTPQRTHQLYAAEAEVLQQVGEIEPAIALLTQAISEYPDDTNLRYSRSSLYEQSNQLDLMENDLRHALSIEPENASTLNALGYFLTSRTDRHDEAYGLIQKALELKPNDPAIMDSMGWVLYKLGRNSEAIYYLRKAFELFPDPEVAAHLGEALWMNGDKQGARSIWSNNLKDNPNDSRIIDTMERLQVTPS